MIHQRNRNWWLFLYVPLIAILLGAVIGFIVERAVLGALVYGLIGLKPRHASFTDPCSETDR